MEICAAQSMPCNSNLVAAAAGRLVAPRPRLPRRRIQLLAAPSLPLHLPLLTRHFKPAPRLLLVLK